MQNTAGPGAAAQSEARQDTDDRIVSDLESLIEHVQATMYRIEEALVRESAAGNQEIADNIVVLDDVTPRYVKANAALRNSPRPWMPCRTGCHRSGEPATSTIDGPFARKALAGGVIRTFDALTQRSTGFRSGSTLKREWL